MKYIIDLIFNDPDPKKYLNEELFEELCNNNELTNDEIDRELLKKFILPRPNCTSLLTQRKLKFGLCAWDWNEEW